MTMLSFGKWLYCFESSIVTSGAIWYIEDFPYPVGKLTNTSLPLSNSESAFSCCGLRFWTPNVEHTPETASLVVLAHDFLLPSSVNARSLAIKLFIPHKLFASGDKLTRQQIRTTTRFLGSVINRQHYRPVLSDVSLPKLARGGGSWNSGYYCPCKFTHLVMHWVCTK